MSKQPARPRKGEPIQLVIARSTGAVRYRTVLDHAPRGSLRQQRRATFDTLTEARAHVASVKADREAGALPTRDRDSFDSFADEYLAERRPHVRPVTLTGYAGALAHARRAFGSTPVGKVSVTDVERLADDMAERGSSRRTVSLTLMTVRAVLTRAMRQGATVRNAADGVQAHGKISKARQALTACEVTAVAEKARAHRLAAGWFLTLAGLRRSEVLGLRWSDLDLSHEAPTLCVRNGRIGDTPTLTPPKTRRGARTLPLGAEMAATLRAFRSEVAGSLGIASVSSDRFVIVDEAGEPVRPETYSDEWARLCHTAGIRRRVLLHEARHSSVTTMRAAGIPDRIVAAWHGHDESVMRATYDHADQDRVGLAEAGAVLAELQRGVV